MLTTPIQDGDLNKQFLENLVDLGIHYGNTTRSSAMGEYLSFKHKNYWIFNVEKIAPMVRKAIELLRTAVLKKEKILIIHTPDDPVRSYIEELWKKYDQIYITSRYPGGTLTNKEFVLQSINKLQQMEHSLEKKFVSGKQEKMIKMAIKRGNKKWGGIKHLKKDFSLILSLNCNQLRILAKEAKMTGKTLIALCDSNVNNDVLQNIDYVIPGNNSSSKVCSYILREGVEIPMSEIEKTNTSNIHGNVNLEEEKSN